MASYQVSEKLKEKCLLFLDEFLINLDKCALGFQEKVTKLTFES